jgi:hypothetical protein
MTEGDKFTVSDPDDWWPPAYETPLEMPAEITALWTVGERVFATLANGRTADLTQLITKTPQ